MGSQTAFGFRLPVLEMSMLHMVPLKDGERREICNPDAVKVLL